MTKKILVTGGAGFVGHHVVSHLVEATDWDIVTLDRLDFSGNLNRISTIMEKHSSADRSRVRTVFHDLRAAINPDTAKLIGEVDYIFHLAAASHVTRSIQRPMEFVYDNIVGTANLLEYSRDIPSLKRMIYFSTDEVFGPTDGQTSFSEYDRYNSTSPYSASKAAAEELCVAFSNTYKLPIYITHTMNIIGERQSEEKFIPYCIRAVNEGKKIKVHFDPSTQKIGSRSYLYAKDIADALLFLLRMENYEVPNKYVPMRCPKFNISGLQELNNLEVAQIIAESIGVELKYELIDPQIERPGHDHHYKIDGSLMKSIGWEPKFDLRMALRHIVEDTLKIQS